MPGAKRNAGAHAQAASTTAKKSKTSTDKGQAGKAKSQSTKGTPKPPKKVGVRSQSAKGKSRGKTQSHPRQTAFYPVIHSEGAVEEGSKAKEATQELRASVYPATGPACIQGTIPHKARNRRSDRSILPGVQHSSIEQKKFPRGACFWTVPRD